MLGPVAPLVELRCPDCSDVLARLRSVRLSVGRPFEECPKCRTLVGRPSSNEWDLLGLRGKAYWIVDRLFPFVVLGFAPAAAYWALVLRHGSGDDRMLLALLGAGPLLITSFPLWAARHVIRRSRARMTDPMYRARLVEFGRRRPSVT